MFARYIVFYASTNFTQSDSYLGINRGSQRQ